MTGGWTSSVERSRCPATVGAATCGPGHSGAQAGDRRQFTGECDVPKRPCPRGRVAADNDVGQRRRAAVEQAAADAGRVAADDDVGQRERAVVVADAPAAVRAAPGDRHPREGQRPTPDVEDPAPAVALECQEPRPRADDRGGRRVGQDQRAADRFGSSAASCRRRPGRR